MISLPEQDLAAEVLALPGPEAQRRFLSAHPDALTEALAWALKRYADRFLRADLQRALATADLLYHMAELTGDPAHRALGLLAEANARSIGQGDYPRGIALYDEAAALYAAAGRPADQARSQVGKVGALLNLGRFAEAQAVGQWASEVLERHAAWQPLATLTMNLAVAHAEQGQDAEALPLLDRAGELYQRLGGPDGEAGWVWTQQNRSEVLRNLGRFEASIQASQTACAALDALGQPAEAARARQNLALTYFVLGRYNEALALLDQVRAVFLEDGRLPDAMLVELSISTCLLRLRRFSEVMEKCARVRTHFGQLGTQRFAAQAIVLEGIALAELGRYPEALASLDEARTRFQAEGNQVWTASADLEAAAVWLRQDQPEAAQTAARACAAVFQTFGLPVEEAQAHLIAARAALRLDDRARVRSLVDQVLAIGAQLKVPSLTYRGHALHGGLAEAEGDLNAALLAYDQALRDVENLRGRLMVEFRAGFLEDKEAIYRAASRVCLALGEPARGLEYAERAKSRALLDLVAQRLDLRLQAKDAQAEPLVADLLRLRAERDQLYRRWEGAPPAEDPGALEQADRQRARAEGLALEARMTDLWHRLLIHNADYAREAALWTVRTEPIQPYLEPGAVLVAYAALEAGLVAYVVTAEAVHARQLALDPDRLTQALAALHQNFQTVPTAPPAQRATLAAGAQNLLGRLYQWLWAPIADLVAGYPQVLVVPHGPLHYVPFHALHDGRAFLLEQCTLTYLPAASFLRYSREARPAPGGLAAFGHSHQGRLPHAVAEAQAVAARLGGAAWVEGQATRAEFLRRAGACRVVHLAAHGDFRLDNPLFSGLALEDGWLTTLDIFNSRLPAGLVTLSACDTGRNVIGGGDELLGLMRAFLCAGAASVALTFWEVEDASTSQLMASFYEALAQGAPKGAALRSAQLALRGSGPYAHPYFWAPFFLVGDYGPL